MVSQACNPNAHEAEANQEDQEFEGSLGYMVSSRSVFRARHCSQNQKQTKQEKKKHNINMKIDKDWTK